MCEIQWGVQSSHGTETSGETDIFKNNHTTKWKVQNCYCVKDSVWELMKSGEIKIYI